MSIGFQTVLKREFLRFFRVPNNTILPQFVSIFLYIVIFGLTLGNRIREVSGFSYLDFLIPGLIMMNVINGSYSNPSGSLFVSRWQGNIHDLLVSPLSYLEMVVSFIIGGMARGLVFGFGTLLIAAPFAALQMHSLAIFLIYVLLTSFVFSCFGILIGLWAERWDQLNIFLNFFITPLTFLGGVFYSIDMIPGKLQVFTKFNPLFYMIDGTRYGMLGVKDGSLLVGLGILVGAAVVLFSIAVHLFRIGWKLRT